MNTDVQRIAADPNPIQMPVSEIITGSYKFNIPSYQRGYRWESSEPGDTSNKSVKQVDDLLNDLTLFAETSNQGNYFLQPLMVKPRIDDVSKEIIWDVLDGQQRLTTMLLILICLNEKLNQQSPLPLYQLEYASRKSIDFSKITYDQQSPDYDYPSLSDNLDSFYVRKAKDRIEQWYLSELNDPQKIALRRKLQEMLFDPDSSRVGNNGSRPNLRVLFIWYNVQPVNVKPATQNASTVIEDIEVFNRLNRGKISLTDSELIKALFLLCVKRINVPTSSEMSPETLVRTWDDMGKRFQDDSFWSMICPKKAVYSNRMDILFDIIKDSNGSGESAYRYYYKMMHPMLITPDLSRLTELWHEVKREFDKLCKWYEDTKFHNKVGFLVDCGLSIPAIKRDLRKNNNLERQIIKQLNIGNVDDIDDLTYKSNRDKIEKILLLFNVMTCDKYGQKFPFGQYRASSYDIEHVNSQTDNPIDKLDEKISWIKEQALECLKYDRLERDNNGFSQSAKDARELIIEGLKLWKRFRKDGKDTNDSFKEYRSRVEAYYLEADANALQDDESKDHIGNLTLLNSSVNREYKNALFPKKLRVLKRSDQEGLYIPLCTKYMFLKYYSNTTENASAFTMMRWRESDQTEYQNAIKNTINELF